MQGAGMQAESMPRLAARGALTLFIPDSRGTLTLGMPSTVSLCHHSSTLHQIH
jgi:hypothetical protein